jgi:hypothetical protein
MDAERVAFVRALGEDEIERWRMALNAARSAGRGA